MGRLTTIKPRVQPLGQVAKGPWTHARPSRHDRGYGSEWVRTVKRIRARDHDLCQECKRRADGVLGMYGAIDHKVPKTEGGSDDDSNLEVICDPCHTLKTEAERLRGLGQG